MIAKKAKILLAGTAILTLAACGSQKSGSNEAAEGAVKNNFETSVTNEGTAIDGALLRNALVSDSPFAGVLSSLYSSTAPDGTLIDYFDEGLFKQDENYRIKEGLAKLTLDKENKRATVTIKKDVKWSDGQPFTIDDYIYSFEVIGHKDYTGTRYNDDFKNIVGMEEYHTGQADTISGMVKNDDYSVTIQFKEVSPSLLQVGGLWSSAAPKHILKDIPIKDQASSDVVRKSPVGLGAFRVTKIVAGESVTYEANPYYWKGQIKLKGAIVEVVSSSSAADEFKAGKYDFMSVPNSTAAVDAFKKLKNGNLLGRWEHAYTYIGFKTGVWNSETEKNDMLKDGKMSNKQLRQAMGYALDFDEISESFYGSLRVRANTLMPPTFAGLHDDTIEGFKYNKEKAIKLLDEAGYKDVDGDGLREKPNGEKLEIRFASMSGGEVAEPLAQAVLQGWKEIGLDVKLTDDRLLEFNSFYQRLEKDDPGIDVYMGAWSLSGDPNPSSLWGDTSENFTRFVSEEQNKLFEAIGSQEAFDADKQKELFKKWQAYQLDEAYAIPVLYRSSITAVNKRVKFYKLSTDSDEATDWTELELTATTPVADK